MYTGLIKVTLSFTGRERGGEKMPLIVDTTFCLQRPRAHHPLRSEFLFRRKSVSNFQNLLEHNSYIMSSCDAATAYKSWCCRAADLDSTNYMSLPIHWGWIGLWNSLEQYSWDDIHKNYALNTNFNRISFIKNLFKELIKYTFDIS